LMMMMMMMMRWMESRCAQIWRWYDFHCLSLWSPGWRRRQSRFQSDSNCTSLGSSSCLISLSLSLSHTHFQFFTTVVAHRQEEQRLWSNDSIRILRVEAFVNLIMRPCLIILPLVLICACTLENSISR
jgi:hypothetical protein